MLNLAMTVKKERHQSGTDTRMMIKTNLTLYISGPDGMTEWVRTSPSPVWVNHGIESISSERISDHGASSLFCKRGSTIKSPWVSLLQVSTHTDMIVYVARTQTFNKQINKQPANLQLSYLSAVLWSCEKWVVVWRSKTAAVPLHICSRGSN